MNYSRQRELIIETLKNTDTHPTAETVYRTLKSAYPKLSLATVYRNLNQLCDMGVIKKLNIANSSDRFDGNMETHYHMYCKVCRKVIDIKASVSSWQALLLPNTSHHVEACDVLFFGTCASCANK